MHTYYLLPVLFLSFFLSAQKPISGSEWCALGHRHEALQAPPVDDRRSDSIDLLRTVVELDLLTANTLSGVASLSFTSKLAGVDRFTLDLEGLPVSNVQLNGVSIPFVYKSPKLYIALPTPLAQGESGVLRVVYRGNPVKDGSGWGGVYFQNPYTYNLGVGFDADPHSFGRAWVPCFDSFV